MSLSISWSRASALVNICRFVTVKQLWSLECVALLLVTICAVPLSVRQPAFARPKVSFDRLAEALMLY